MLQWLLRLVKKNKGKNPTDPLKPNKRKKGHFKIEELRAIQKSEKCILIIAGCVYDVTNYVTQHPGGIAVIEDNHAIDCTRVFSDVHSDRAKAMLKKYKIGVLDLD